jgi:hypothetical protein
MPSRLILLLAFLIANFAFAQEASKPTAVNVASVEPACPELRGPAIIGKPMLPPHITIRYNPNAPGARLASAQSVSLVRAKVHQEPTIMPMVRAADGTWQAEFDAYFNLIIFSSKDGQGRIDNNRGECRDIPCPPEQQAGL